MAAPNDDSLTADEKDGGLERAALAAALGDEQARAAAGCAPPEVWHRLAMGGLEGGLEPEAENRWRAHASSCPLCAAELRLAESFEAPAAAGGPSEHEVARVVAAVRRGRGAPAGPRAARWRERGAWLAAAAVGALAIGFALWRGATPPPVGDPGDPAVVRGAQIEVLAPLGEQAGWPGELRWHGGPAAHAYRVEIRRVDGELLLERTTPAPPLGVDEEMRRLLLPEVTYRFTVRALNAQGRELASSPPAAFVVNP